MSEDDFDVTPEDVPTPDEPDGSAAGASDDAGEREEQSARAASPSDPPDAPSAPAEEQSEEPAPEEVPAEVAEEPVAEAEAPADDETAAESEEGASGEELPRAPSDATGEAAASAPGSSAAETPASAEDAASAPGSEAAETPASSTAATPEEIGETPREKPEIPGLELEPDVMPEGEQYLDAEAQAAAEAEAEEAARRAAAEAEESSPIAHAAIDLGAGARYTATGKRKTAVARVIVKPGAGTYSINGKPLEVMFPRETLQRMIRQPLETVGYESRMDVVARMHGGGVSAQAGALRHGISRALIDADPNLRGELKRRGFLTRDPRVKERKKAGLKKARKRPQFSKR